MKRLLLTAAILTALSVTGPDRLTNSAADDRGPAWSPDGAYILFESNRNGNWDIFRMATDGSNKSQITSSVADERYPAWSPSGLNCDDTY